PDDKLLYSVTRDISEERRKLEELNRSNQLLEATQATTMVGGWEVDIVHQTLYWTKETFNIHETTPEEYTPTVATAIQLCAPTSVPLITKAFEKALNYGEAFDLELEIITFKGKQIKVRSVGKPQVEDGKVTRLTGIFLDITEAKRLAAQLEDQRKLLITSAKMSSLGEMSAAIGHEINNPLAIINGSLLIIDRIIGSDELNLTFLKDQIDIIKLTSNRIVKIIRGLQYFSRNSDHDPLTPLSFKQIVIDTIGFCQERFKRNGVDLIIEIDKVSSEYIQSRGNQLSQVLLNLFNNSVDAVRDLPVKWVKLHAITDQDRLIVSVTDSGNGIDREIVSKLMEPFFSTKGPGMGTGLGLNISKRIIEVHSGVLYYDAKNPHTSFVFEIPLKRAVS
ncbi:MAG: PAS domain-containing protein, partial [Bdellovibrionales bacterium]|nr:PAS domain-containing protein [Bdellovibrionales bacterium]